MIIIRADGNSSVGLGHVMRCLSIADSFKKAGESCLFVMADNDLVSLIRSHGHMSIVLNSEYDHMEDELEAFQKVIDAGEVDTIFVDSYFATDHYLRSLRQFCVRKNITLVYVDDILAFHYPCDVLLNYNIYASETDYKNFYRNISLPNFMLGTSYAPLRAEFQNLPDRIVNKEAKDILISAGGADLEHIGSEVVKTIIAHKEWGDYNFHIIVGTMSGDRELISSLTESKDNIKLYPKVEKMSELMQACDLAVSAAGSTLYELCATQTPTITYILADNQIPGARGFEKAGVFKCIGDVREIGLKNFAEKILTEAVNLAKDYNSRMSIASRAKKVVDGNGADRIVQEVLDARRIK